MSRLPGYDSESSRNLSRAERADAIRFVDILATDCTTPDWYLRPVEINDELLTRQAVVAHRRTTGKIPNPVQTKPVAVAIFPFLILVNYSYM